MICGWCIPCRQDQPSTPDRRCIPCGQILIAPSWSHKDAPFPWPERPEGWVWVQPTEAEPKPNKQRGSQDLSAHRKPAPKAKAKQAKQPEHTFVCRFCGATFTLPPAGGSDQQYCSRSHRDRARRARDRERLLQTFQPYPCEACPTLITTPSHNGGPPRRYCSAACRKADYRDARREAVA